jgi:hypothetical protein
MAVEELDLAGKSLEDFSEEAGGGVPWPLRSKKLRPNFWEIFVEAEEGITWPLRSWKLQAVHRRSPLAGVVT